MLVSVIIMLVIGIVLLKASLSCTLMREPAVGYPARHRVHIDGLQPRMIQFRFTTQHAIGAIIFDPKYNVTDAGIVAGETFDGIIKQFKMHRKEDNAYYIKVDDKDCMSKLAKFAHMISSPYGHQLSEISEDYPMYYDDDMPVTATDEHPYWIIIGPFPPGTYTITVDLAKPTDEWGGASLFSCDAAFRAIIIPNYRGPYVRYAAKTFKDETEVEFPACDAVYLSTVTNLSKVIIGNYTWKDTELEDIERFWNLSVGQQWKETVQTDLGWNNPIRDKGLASYTTGTTVSVVIMRHTGSATAIPVSKVPKQQKRRNLRKGKRKKQKPRKQPLRRNKRNLPPWMQEQYELYEV